MKHEKAIAVLLAYIIGFITAYIAFGLTDVNYGEDVSSDKAPVVSNSDQKISTKEDDKGLYVVIGDKIRIISAKVASAEEADLGYHSEVVTTSVSPDGKFVYYCTAVEDSSSCAAFVYDTASDITHTMRASDDSKQLTLNKSEASCKWLRSGGIELGGYYSTNSNQPWLVKAE